MACEKTSSMGSKKTGSNAAGGCAECGRVGCLPEACYYQGILLCDPVVGPDGFSREKNAIHDCDNMAHFYPNRALKGIIDCGLGDCPRLHNGNQPVHKNLHCCCPITHELFQDPVIDPEGQTYERKPVEEWIKLHGKSPMTRSPLSSSQLYPNVAMAKVMASVRQRQDLPVVCRPQKAQPPRRPVTRSTTKRKLRSRCVPCPPMATQSTRGYRASRRSSKRTTGLSRGRVRRVR